MAWHPMDARPSAITMLTPRQPWVIQVISCNIQGPVSIYDKMSYRKISWSLEAARFVFRIVRSLWHLTGTSAALLPRCLSNFKTMRYFKLSISRLQDFMRSYDKTLIYWNGAQIPLQSSNKVCLQEVGKTSISLLQITFYIGPYHIQSMSSLP